MERVLAGRYELESPLGSGGSGEVWRGRDMATRHPVAIKLVELSHIDDPGLLAETIGRFRREAMVVAGLRHPNIVGSLDAGRIGNQLFMIMELAPGVSLAGMMDERGARGMGLFPVSSVLRMAQQTSAGLAAAHAAGVVHRDIKPSNLMVTPRLEVKIIDFGIAQLLADNSPRLTLRGHTVGTIAYMSPEQAQGDPVDARADLYALGCVLYQLLSGRLPFRSQLPSALLMMQVMDQAIPLSSFRPDLPAELTRLVSDLMEKDRAARPADAAEVIGRLAAISGDFHEEEPLIEADRQTVGAFDSPGGTGAETWRDDFQPEPGRAAVLVPERPLAPEPPVPPPSPSPLGRETVGIPPWEIPQAVAVPPGLVPPTVRENAVRENAVRENAVGQNVVGQNAASENAVSPSANGPGPGRRTSGGVPAWPVPPKRRPRRRWAPVLSTLLTIAIAAGVWIYVWDRAHAKLAITYVAVTATNASVGCDGTANIVGTITTNGRGGPIEYEWIGPNADPQVQTTEDASGSDTVRVTQKWVFRNKGTGKSVAQLRVLKPGQAEASITFPYVCPG
jgi:serine/threonine protein kinase